jgi:hypothetical protein
MAHRTGSRVPIGAVNHDRVNDLDRVSLAPIGPVRRQEAEAVVEPLSQRHEHRPVIVWQDEVEVSWLGQSHTTRSARLDAEASRIGAYDTSRHCPSADASHQLACSAGSPLPERLEAQLHASGDPLSAEGGRIRAQVRSSFLDDDPAWLERCWARYESVVSAAADQLEPSG